MAFAAVLVCVAGGLVNTSQDGHPRDDTADTVFAGLISCLHDAKTGYPLVFSPGGRG
jgi:hypothetical protein